MMNIKNTLVAMLLFVCSVASADYMCVENNTDRTIRFRIVDGHYDVFLCSFVPEKGGLVDQTSLMDGKVIELSPAQKLMFRTMYSYEKSGSDSALELLDETGSIVFASDSFDDFKLSDAYDVSVFSQPEVLDDDFLGIADRIYKITKSPSAPSSPRKELESNLTGRKRSASDPSSSKTKADD